MTRRTLLRGGCVLTLGAKTANHPQADVLIEDGRIAQVGTSLRARDADIVDATDTIVMPGFIDVHRHLWKTLLKHTEGVAGGCTDAGHAPDVQLSADDLYASTMLGLLTAAETGITTLVDWTDVVQDDESTAAILQAYADAGLRTVLVRSPGDRDAGGPGSDEVARSAQQRGALTTVACGAPHPDRESVDATVAAITAARGGGLRTHVHVGTSAGSSGIVALLGERGVLGPDVTLARCAALSAADLAAIARHGAAVALTPSLEMASGVGLPPLQQLIDRGIRPGLGVGEELFAPGDIFTQMRAVQSLQHATLFDLKLSGKGSVPNLLNTRDVIRYATADGARVAGLGDVVGSLEPGKQADVILLRTDAANIAPVNDPIGAVVWGMDASNVDSVLVAGKPVMRGGALVADEQHVRRLALEARARLPHADAALASPASGGAS